MPHTYKIFDIDPALLSYEGDIRLRMDNFRRKKAELVGENGSLCVFNNDKRGVAPDGSAMDEANAIHPYFYSFAGYAPRYAISTGLDDCDIPNLEKSTTPATVAIGLRSIGTARVYCECDTEREAYTDDGGFCSGGVSFDSLSFDNLCFDPSSELTAICYSAPKRWIAKRITLSTDGFRAPLALRSITYRFKISGRIKNR